MACVTRYAWQKFTWLILLFIPCDLVITNIFFCTIRLKWTGEGLRNVTSHEPKNNEGGHFTRRKGSEEVRSPLDFRRWRSEGTYFRLNYVAHVTRPRSTSRNLHYGLEYFVVLLNVRKAAIKKAAFFENHRLSLADVKLTLYAWVFHGFDAIYSYIIRLLPWVLSLACSRTCSVKRKWGSLWSAWMPLVKRQSCIN